VPRLLLCQGSMIKLRHTTLSSGRVISSSQGTLPDNKQQSQQTDIHVPGGIRTHNSSMRAAADPSLRPRGQWDQHTNSLLLKNPVILSLCTSRRHVPRKWIGVISPLILNYGARWRSGVNFPLWIHNPDERTSRY
jgi:hypothetical protein